MLFNLYSLLTISKIKEWIAYAAWEANQGEYDRSRSVYERALDVDGRNVKIWLSYTEMACGSLIVSSPAIIYALTSRN